jgi:hypothetical protein
MPRDIRMGRSYAVRRLSWLVNGVCPYCGSTNITVTDTENGGKLCQCLDCDAVNPFTRGPKANKKKRDEIKS